MYERDKGNSASHSVQAFKNLEVEEKLEQLAASLVAGIRVKANYAKDVQEDLLE